MPTITLTDEPLPITRALGRVLDDAGITNAAHAARVFDEKARPALILIADGELAFVTTRGVQRWTPAELASVDGARIVPVMGDPVRIGAWYQVSRRGPFLSAVRAFRGLPEPPPAPPVVYTPPQPENTTGLATAVAVLGGIVVLLGLAGLAAHLLNASAETGLLVATVIASIVVSVPLLVASLKLAARESPWWLLSIAGIVLGGVGVAAMLLAVVVVIGLGISCGSEGCLR